MKGKSWKSGRNQRRWKTDCSSRFIFRELVYHPPYKAIRSIHFLTYLFTMFPVTSSLKFKAVAGRNRRQWKEDMVSKQAEISNNSNMPNCVKTQNLQTHGTGFLQEENMELGTYSMWFTWGISKPRSCESNFKLLFFLVCKFLSSFTFYSKIKDDFHNK